MKKINKNYYYVVLTTGVYIRSTDARRSVVTFRTLLSVQPVREFVEMSTPVETEEDVRKYFDV